MIAQRYVWLIAAMLIGTLAGCLGGSGSSGFENAAIEAAIDSQECQYFEGLMICPAEPLVDPRPTATATPTLTPPAGVTSTVPIPQDTPTFPTPGVTGTPTPPEQTTVSPTNTQRAQSTPTIVPTATVPPAMQVETNLGPSSDINCTDDSACSFTFFYVAIGFPDDAMYRTASRDSDDQPWALSEPTGVADPRPAHATFRDQIPIDPPNSAPAGVEPTIQFAVLVFLNDPGELPSSVSRLGDTGADFAYVLPPVPVSTIGF